MLNQATARPGQTHVKPRLTAKGLKAKLAYFEACQQLCWEHRDAEERAELMLQEWERTSFQNAANLCAELQSTWKNQ